MDNIFNIIKYSIDVSPVEYIVLTTESSYELFTTILRRINEDLGSYKCPIKYVGYVLMGELYIDTEHDLSYIINDVYVADDKHQYKTVKVYKTSSIYNEIRDRLYANKEKHLNKLYDTLKLVDIVEKYSKD